MAARRNGEKKEPLTHDNSQVLSLTLLDMTKAFNPIDINCVLEKLYYYYDVSGRFCNYLHGSNSQKLTSSSILGPFCSMRIGNIVK